MIQPSDCLPAGQRESQQLQRLRSMVAVLLETNEFYGHKLRQAGISSADDLKDLAAYRDLPFTTREELSADQQAHPPFGTNLTFPTTAYLRIHQTSGTMGQPLRWLDTQESWSWWADCWSAVYRAAGVGSGERIFFAFSFGPFIGFWSALEGARAMGCLAISGGGMSTEQRLNSIVDNGATVLVCTPTYALHLAEVAATTGLELAASTVSTTIHAGEPGASLPATKRRIEEAWGARCFDHAGATEVGAWGYQCDLQDGLHLNENEFMIEVIDPDTGDHTDDGELVITNLGRTGSPVLRYRTGDRIKLAPQPCACGRTLVRAEGGVMGRIDDALIVRGLVFFPSAIENTVREFDAVTEFAVDVYRRGSMDEVRIQIEANGEPPRQIEAAVAKALQLKLGLRMQVTTVQAGSLPRFELKSRRVTDHRVAEHQ